MTTKQPVGPPVTPCYDQLAALLSDMRTDTTYDAWRNAMLATQTIGWTYTRCWNECFLIIRDGGGPRDLLNAAGPLARTREDHP